MQASRTKDDLVLDFGLLEKQILLPILHSIIRNYRLKPEDLSAKASQAWYATHGCKAAKMSSEETREWLDALHQVKSANVALMETWAAELAKGTNEGFQLTVKIDEAPVLLSVLNDHRLLTAAENDIADDQMEIHSLTEIEQLPPEQQTALYEIHFLAWIMEELLRLAAPEAANWSGSVET